MTTLSERLLAEGIRLSRYDEGNYKLTCPNCSKTRKHSKDRCLSVTIDSEGATWRCHNTCGFEGGFKDGPDRPLMNRTTNGGPKRRAPDLTKIPNGLLPDFVMAWFRTERGIGAETLEAAQIRWGRWWYSTEEGEIECIVFPYHDAAGAPTNAKFRTMGKQFRQVPGATPTLYRLHACDPALGQLVIVEGELDALACLEAGIPNVVSIPDGAVAKVKPGAIDPENDKKFNFLRNCEPQLKAYSKIVLFCDADDAGRATNEELARRLGRERCYLAEAPAGYKDANEILAGSKTKGLPALGADDLAACINAARPYPLKSIFTASTYRDAVLALYREGRKPGFSTGWSSVDEFLTIAPGQVTVVTGVPNHGKSEWVDALVMNLARLHGWRFGICSFENPGDEHVVKVAEKYVRAPFWPGPRQRMGERELLDAIDWLDERLFFIRTEDESPTIDWALEGARGCLLRHGIRGLVLDPWNRFEHRRPNGISETEYVGEILSRVQRFAAASGVHVFFVAHPAKLYREKGGDVPIPTLYDIAGSAHWANICDNGLTVHRDDEKHLVELHIHKVRFKHIGKRGVVRLKYDLATGCYSELGGDGAYGRARAYPDD